MKNYFLKIEDCKELLNKANLEILCFCNKKELIKKTKDLDYVITYISLNNLYNLKEKHVYIEIKELNFIYEEEFNRIDFLDKLLYKLRLYLNI